MAPCTETQALGPTLLLHLLDAMVVIIGNGRSKSVREITSASRPSEETIMAHDATFVARI